MCGGGRAYLCVWVCESRVGALSTEREEVELEGISHSAGFLPSTGRWLLLAFFFFFFCAVWRGIHLILLFPEVDGSERVVWVRTRERPGCCAGAEANGFKGDVCMPSYSQTAAIAPCEIWY